MNQKTAITAGVVVILAGAGVFLATRHPGDSAAATPPAKAAASTPVHSGPTPAEEAAEKAKARKDREQARDSELIAKYGESRTNLSRKIAGDVAGLLEDVVSMREAARSNPNFGGPGNGLRRSLGGTFDKLNLTDEQQEKATKAYSDYQARQTEKTKQTVDDLKKDPDTLMRLFLTGDSYKRGEISEEDFKSYEQASASDLGKIMNPLDRKNFEGGQPLRDPEFQKDLAGILEPSQNQDLQSAVDEDAKKTAGGSDTDITNLPAMNLEKLDQTVTNARKMTNGIKQMMEGMGGLQDLGPMIEAQKKAKQGGQ